MDLLSKLMLLLTSYQNSMTGMRSESSNSSFFIEQVFYIQVSWPYSLPKAIKEELKKKLGSAVPIILWQQQE